MSRGIRVAVIGAGMAGRAHAHGYRSAGTVFSAGLPPVRLVSVADINAEVAANTARQYGFERSDTSWQDIVSADDIDAVSVVVANSLHREIVGELAAAGKHILCEKPLAPTSADAQAMSDAVDPQGLSPELDSRSAGRQGSRRCGSSSSPAGSAARSISAGNISPTTAATGRPRSPGGTAASPGQGPWRTSAATSPTPPSSCSGRSHR